MKYYIIAQTNQQDISRKFWFENTIAHLKIADNTFSESRILKGISRFLKPILDFL